MSEERTPGVPMGAAFPWSSQSPRERFGPWLASLWLIFLLPAFVDGWQDRSHTSGIVGMAATAAFMLLYSANFFGSERARMRFINPPSLTWAIGYIGALLALAVVMTVAVGPNASATAVFIAVSGIIMLPIRGALALDVVLVAVVLVAGHERGWSGQGGVVLGMFLGSLAVFGMRTVVRRNIQLWHAHDQNTRLAVEGERNRFARDLHDILGHSLTVITVKAELAQRLLDTDPERARAEVADLERLSRDALADVRRAVEGYRELTLPGELARARAALAAAQIEPIVPQAADAVPTELRELFAWTVREGVTNVIRHSRAGRCEILLSPTSAEVRDDGAGASGAAEGSGLTGLRERAADVGAVVVTRSLRPGFLLQVARP